MPLRFRQGDPPEPTHTQHVQIPASPLAGFLGGTLFTSARQFGIDHPVKVEAASPSMLHVAMALAGELPPSDSAVLTGVACPYGKPSSDLARVVFRAGCFAESIKGDIALTFNFDATRILGRTRSGTLQLIDDQDALRFEVLPPETRWASDLLVSIARNDIRAIVCALQVTQQRVERDQRIIEKATLLGCAVSSFYGFDSGFQISRAKGDDEDTDEQDADFLKQLGVSGGVK